MLKATYNLSGLFCYIIKEYIMKKILFTLLLSVFSITTFASQAYVCPQKIICAGGKCYLPQEFQNPFPNNTVINIEFTFYKAANLPLPLCQYNAKGKFFNQQFYFVTSLNSRPNTKISNDWAVSAGGAAICGSTNPLNCPWTID